MGGDLSAQHWLARWRPPAVALAALCAAGCAPAPDIALPAGAGAADPGALALYERAAGACRTASSVTLEAGVHGRIGAQRVRGRFLAGIEGGRRIRLEALAGFGQPVFILVASDDRAALLLPRDRRVLEDAALVDVLDAVAGLRLSTADLQAMLLGCVAAGDVSRGVGLGGGVYAVAVGDAARAFVRTGSGRPRVFAGEIWAHGARTVMEYGQFLEGGGPRLLRLQRRDGAASVTLTLELRDVEIGTAIDPAAFRLAATGGATALTLDELRSAGLLASR